MADKKKEPKYSIAAKFNDVSDKEKRSFPSPNAYNIPSKVVEKQGKTFGLKLGSSMEGGNKFVPGPGTYSQDKQKRDDYKYSMGAKLDGGNSKNNSPGPGMYETRQSLEGQPSTKFGTG